MANEQVAEAATTPDDEGFKLRRPFRTRSVRVEIGPLPVLCDVRPYRERVGSRRITNEETGARIDVPEYAEFLEYVPRAYTVTELKKRLRRIVANVVQHPKSFIRIHLLRFEQVATVMGQLKAEFGPHFTFGWTTDDEENTLFEVRYAVGP